MNTEQLLEALETANRAVLGSEAEIEGLDRHIGDGDHFLNVRRGFAALLAMREELAPLPVGDALKRMGQKIMTTIGGASGPLFGSFLLAWAKSAAEAGQVDGANSVARGFAAGVAAVQARGKAGLGEKTMLDVLIPVARTMARLVEEGAATSEVCERVKEEAWKGMQATKDMIATKGRAQNLGERALGHIDPGAKTAQVVICAVCDLVAPGAGTTTGMPEKG